MNEFTIVRGLFDGRKRSLILDENFIKFENKDRKDDLFTVINKDDIAGIRYGIHFIKGLEFYIGREYQIFITTQSKKELKVNFKLFYRRKLKKKHEMFCEIVNQLWRYYLDDILNHYIQLFNSKQNFMLGGIYFDNSSIHFDRKQIPYAHLAIKEYQHYTVIYSLEDNYINKMLYFLKDHNAVLVSSLINLIIKHRENL